MRRLAQHRKLKQRLGLLALAAALSSTVGLTLRSTDALEPLELDTIDARFSARGDRSPREDIVIVAIDDRSLRETDSQSGAIPREIHARLLERLRAYRPKLVAYDIGFGAPKGRRGDRALIEAMSRTHPLVLSANVVGDDETKVAGLRTTRELGARVGDPRGINDNDGVYRQMPYFTAPKAFAVVVAEVARGRAVDPARFPDGAAWIDYSGPPGSIPQHSFSRVVDGKLSPRAFAGKIVLIGASAPLLKDIVPTPVSADPMPGVEIHANSVATILDDFPLEEPTGTLDLLLTLALAVVGPLVAMRFSTLLTVAAGISSAAAYLVVSQLAFNGGVILPISYPLAGLFVGTAGAAAVDLLLETRERRRLQHTFERFVPKHVVKAVLARADSDLRLGGELLEATVLFCDLRGFSRFGQRHSASTVIETLNRYLTEMTEAIFAHGGTVVSYMGDGIMAVFGAPIEQEDNADRAYAAAREMLEQRLPAFNAWISEKGFGEGFRMGIGLCSGPVMSGNVGSDRRVEYTAVGDTTNLAARLEEKNKQHGSQLLIAESTRVRLSVPEAELVYVGDELIPGRSGTLKIWTTKSPAGAGPPQATAATSHKA